MPALCFGSQAFAMSPQQHQWNARSDAGGHCEAADARTSPVIVTCQSFTPAPPLLNRCSSRAENPKNYSNSAFIPRRSGGFAANQRKEVLIGAPEICVCHRFDSHFPR